MARERYLQKKEEELKKIAIAIEKLRTVIELRRRSGKNLRKRLAQQDLVIRLISRAKKISAEIANG